MNTQQQPKLMTMQANPTNWSIILLSFGVVGLCVWSRIIMPAPPRLNMKLLASPSMMYWPLTLERDLLSIIYFILFVRFKSYWRGHLLETGERFVREISQCITVRRLINGHFWVFAWVFGFQWTGSALSLRWMGAPPTNNSHKCIYEHLTYLSIIYFIPFVRFKSYWRGHLLDPDCLVETGELQDTEMVVLG